MLIRQIGRAVGSDDEHALGRQRARQKGQQVEGRPVGPVQVLQDEEAGTVDAKPIEQMQHCLEDQALRTEPSA